jgi:uncharacterized protein (TIGR02145 family)
MKKVLSLIISVCFVTCFVALNSCNDKEDETTIIEVIPISNVTTKPVSAFSSTQAIAGGVIGDNGRALSIVRGLCWNTEPDPDTTFFFFDETVTDPGSFTWVIGPLLPDTTYYIRAFAANKAGITYADEVSFTTNPCLTDIEGRTYGTVNIGSQVWITENLGTTKYNDGEPIPLVINQSDWRTLSGSGYYSPKVVDGFGDTLELETLYNWHTVNTGKLCPTGWHVPTDAEWLVLAIYIGPDILCSTERGNLEGTYADSYLFNANNTVIRDTISGIVGYKLQSDCKELTPQWWSSTSSSNFRSWYFILNPKVMRLEYSKKYGLPVRCVKD